MKNFRFQIILTNNNKIFLSDEDGLHCFCPSERLNSSSNENDAINNYQVRPDKDILLMEYYE